MELMDVVRSELLDLYDRLLLSEPVAPHLLVGKALDRITEHWRRLPPAEPSTDDLTLF